jgi:NADPH:quinone reductase-like Zn-dependent oxidoreductase
MGQQMHATVMTKHGGRSVLKYTRRPLPRIKPDEVLVRVGACALNHLDIWIRMGLPGVQIPMPHILGCDVAGVIECVGARAQVRGVRAGRRVVIAPGQVDRDDRYTRAGRDSLSPNFRILGLQIDGGYAEYVAVKVKHVIPVSHRYSDAEWAAIPLVFLTAWHMLMSRAGLKKGETVLVQAGGSGVGSAAIQIARWAGAHVITTAGSVKKLTAAKRLGAHETINYRTQSMEQRVRTITKHRGVDVVFDHIGPATWQGSMRSLATGGRLVTCGATSGPQVMLNLRCMYMRELSIAGCYMGGRTELARVVRLVEQGIFKPVVDTVLPLRHAAKAHARMESREHFGKIILEPGQ